MLQILNATSITEAENIAAATYSFLPQGVRDEFIKQYIETGDAGISYRFN